MLYLPSSIDAPGAITVIFKSPPYGVDLTDVTGVTFNVLRADYSSTSWVGEIISSTPGELVAQYVFTGAGEITSTGLYYLSPALAVQGGNLIAETVSAYVASPFNFTPKLEESAWVPATVAVTSLGPTKGTWTPLDETDSPYVAKPTLPLLAVDLTISAVAITLWDANDGDAVMVSDYLSNADTNSLTLTGATGQLLPQGDGTYALSRVYSSPGFLARLKFSEALGLWLEI